MLDLSRKVIIITGSSKGIGRATAELFSSRGAVVYGLSRSLPQGEYHFTSIKCDVTDKEALSEAFETVYKKHGRIDLLVNNAGAGIAGAVEYTSDEAVNSLLDLNFKALETSCRLALKYLRESKGRIVNLSSVAAIIL